MIVSPAAAGVRVGGEKRLSAQHAGKITQIIVLQVLRAAANRVADLVADPDTAAEPAKPALGNGVDPSVDLEALASAPEGGPASAWDDGDAYG